MLNKTERSTRIDELEKVFKDARGIFLTDITKMNVAQATKLRVDFRSKNIKYIVVKNTLARIAAERCGKKELSDHFKGPIGVAVAVDDATVPAKVIRDFQKDNKELLGVKVAYVDGTIYSGDDVGRLADVPSKEVLLSQLLSVLEAPMANLAATLQGALTKFAGTLEAVKNQKESQPQA